MFDVIQVQFPSSRPETRPADAPADAETLRERCLHPAETWALKRRANRPASAPRRLPAVAPVG